MASVQQYLDLYRDMRCQLDGGSCETMNSRRAAAADFLAQHGLPTPKTERYKYTDVEAAFAPDYGLNLNRLGAANPYQDFRCNVPGIGSSLFYVVNDLPFPQREGTAPLPEGVEVFSIKEADEKRRDFIEKFYHKAAAKSPDGITALNTMLAQDGLCVFLAKDTVLQHPLQIVNIASAKTDMMSNRRVIIVAEDGAEASILFCDHAEGNQCHLTTEVTEVYLGKGAKIDLYTIEETNESNTRFAHIYAEQQAGSKLSHATITLHNGLTCNRADIRLLGEQASVSASGAVIGDAKERVDNNLLVEHVSPDCTSDMLYKYVLDGEAIGAFAGKVLVHRDAQRSYSEQTNANLCVSPTSHAYSQPMLEIYADDVKCNHGSTIGKLDETALFYMRQRGIDEKEARLLLQHAFINDVVRRISLDRLRDKISDLVELRFRGELSRCKGCKMCK